MKHKPHILTFRMAVCFSAVFAGCVVTCCQFASLAAQETPAATEEQPAVPSIAVVSDENALDVLKGVRDRLESLPYLECDLNETVHLSELRFYATGRYAQASGNRVRLEFQIFPLRGVKQEDEQTLQLDADPEDTGKQKPSGEMTQVSDGITLWSYWKNGDSRKLSRRNIQEILKVAEETQGFDGLRMFEDLGAGGLQTLLARLETGMEFGKVREQTAGDTRLLVVNGRWTDNALTNYFGLKNAEVPRPAWMPDYVRIYVDAEARLPRRVQYLKKHPDPQVRQVRPLLTLDFRSMAVSDTVDEEQFKFTAPRGLVEVDRTEQTIQSIRSAAAGGAATDGSAPPAADPNAAADTTPAEPETE